MMEQSAYCADVRIGIRSVDNQGCGTVHQRGSEWFSVPNSAVKQCHLAARVTQLNDSGQFWAPSQKPCPKTTSDLPPPPSFLTRWPDGSPPRLRRRPTSKPIALKTAGFIRVWTDKASGALDHRPKPDRVLDHLRPGDTLLRSKEVGHRFRGLLSLGSEDVSVDIAGDAN